jgi:hypothetical protein
VATNAGSELEILDSDQKYHRPARNGVGTEVTQGQQEVLVITPESPLGQFAGKKQSDNL